MKVEFYRHNIGSEEKDMIARCLDGVFLTTGTYVKTFESDFAKYFDASYAVGLTSCTAALHLSLLALGIGPGDEVITTPMSFIATANAILYVGATPIFVDVEPDTGLIDWRLIEKAITPRTKAIIPVHLYGQMCDMHNIRKIADKHGLKIVEDCAHSLEAVRDGMRPAQLGDVACFSFYATKNMTCGEGGAIVTNREDIAERVMVLRQHGMSKSAVDRYAGHYQHWDMIELGWKYNMSNIQAAMLLPQIPRIEERWQKRRDLYELYCCELSKITQIKLPNIYSASKSAFHLFTILTNSVDRDLLLGCLNAAQIGCAVNYRAIHLLQFYNNQFAFKRGDFPNAEDIGDRTVSLPFWIGLERSQVEYIASIVSKFYLSKSRN